MIKHTHKPLPSISPSDITPYDRLDLPACIPNDPWAFPLYLIVHGSRPEHLDPSTVLRKHEGTGAIAFMAGQPMAFTTYEKAADVLSTLPPRNPAPVIVMHTPYAIARASMLWVLIEGARVRVNLVRDFIRQGGVAGSGLDPQSQEFSRSWH